LRTCGDGSRSAGRGHGQRVPATTDCRPVDPLLMSILHHFCPGRWLITTLFVVTGVVGVAACVQFDRWQRQKIFAVETEPRSWWDEPSDATEVFDLRLDNGDTVRAWYWPSPRSDAPTVLYLHGSRWNLNGSAFRFNGWTRMGYSMLAIDYRGFGASTALLPSERSVADDAQAALAELVRRQPDPTRRFVYGHSLGGAIAMDLVAGVDAPPIAGLIIESSFTSIVDMLGVTRWGSLPGLRWLVTQPFASIDKVATLDVPMLFLHGTADRVVPHTMSDALYAAARQAPPSLKRLVKIKDGSHSNGVRAGSIYETTIAGFMRDATRYQQHRSGGH